MPPRRPHPAPSLTLPDPLTPAGFLRAILRARPWLAVATVAVGTLWLVPGAVIPLVVGDAVDAGVAHGDTGALVRDVALVVALGVAQMLSGGALDFLAHGMWLHAASATQRTVSGHVLRLGASLAPQAAGGDVAAVTTSDLSTIGNLFETAGRLAGSVVAFGVVGAGLVARSPLLGVVALWPWPWPRSSRSAPEPCSRAPRPTSTASTPRCARASPRSSPRR